VYAILDIEATGGKKGEEEIIELAIYRYDGKKINDQLISLVSPNRDIDQYVQKLTQITPKLVKSAPKFHELARRVIEITEGAILVGHNVDFDYRMLKQEFKKLGYTYYRETIDTVVLSEKYFPEAESYSLGKLSKELGIPVSDRHRASGDARATLELFKLLQAKDSLKDISKREHLNGVQKTSARFKKYYEDLPNNIGIYYFFDKNDEVIYAAKTLNISQGVRKILTGKSGLSNQIRLNFDRVKSEVTGNELISWIKETHEVKLLKPFLNGRRNKVDFPFAICLEIQNGYKTLAVRKFSANPENILFRMTSKSMALGFLSLITEEFELCPKLNEISGCKDACLSYEVGECRGACLQLEPPEEYNSRVNLFLEKINLKERGFLIIGNGRSMGEKSFVWVQNGVCEGYGYYEFHHQINSPKRIRERMIPVESDVLIDSIVKGFLFTEKYQEIIPVNN
jgi:DNA polymerase-3 subunit epsilon